MDRTIAARSPIGRLGSSPRRRRTGAAVKANTAAATLRRLLASAVDELSSRRRLRLALICLLVAVPLLGGGWMWLCHSSFVSVEQVRVSGADGPQAAAIETALVEAAHGMSTLAPNVGVLRAAVSRFPQVSEVRAVPSFPHRMKIIVVEQSPAAVLVVGGLRTAVASDGVILGPALARPSLPRVANDVAPGVGGRLSNSLLLEALTVLGAAPAQLGGVVARAYVGPRGLTVAMKNGLLVYFGDAERPHAKWDSLISVLSDSSSAGASYIDVRLPNRPAAGFGTAVAAERQITTQTGAKIAGEATVSALAAGLKADSPQPVAPTTEPESTISGAGESPASEEAETAGAPAEGSTTANPELAQPSSSGTGG